MEIPRLRSRRLLPTDLLRSRVTYLGFRFPVLCALRVCDHCRRRGLGKRRGPPVSAVAPRPNSLGGVTSLTFYKDIM